MNSFSSSLHSMEEQPESGILGLDDANGPFRGLPSLYLGLLSVWSISIFCWTSFVKRNRHSQRKNLQWILASAPLAKVVHLGLSLLFWHSCLNMETCSLWISYGVYVFGIFYQITAFVCFVLISHGYCIMFEHLSIQDRRRTGALACLLYYSLIGYRVSIPYSTVAMLICHVWAFFMIFGHIAQNLSALREQISFSHPDQNDRNGVHDEIHTKFHMYKKFRGAMQVIVLVEVMMKINAGDEANDYKFRWLVRECVQFGIFMYIWWIFRPQETSPLLSIARNGRSRTVVPIYRIEINASNFKEMASQSWQIGVPKSLYQVDETRSTDSMLVIIQHPT